ncbi:MAG: hypothetical protein MMC33_010464 [Icmadophila ericetorum]|nr:hypothetical protein [Icmadophila ericetorum]
MSKLLVVIGITGKQVSDGKSGQMKFAELKQGGSVADVYLKEPGWKVRGISRNPGMAQTWIDKGVQMVKGDLDDTESLTNAFKGATAIFSVTDFWQPFFNPANQAKLKPGQTINEWCYEYELQQGKNIADAAAGVQGLNRLIFSATCDATRCSKGKYTWVYHFDSKGRAVEYIKERYPELAAKMSVVQAGAYMDNWKTGGQFTKHTDGTWHLASIGSGDYLVPFFDTVKDMGSVVRVAIQLPPEKNILGVGSMIGWKEYLKIWCDVNKVPFGGYDEISVAVLEAHLQMPGLGREVGEMFLFIEEFGYAGGDLNTILASELNVPCALTTWEDYVKAEDWSTVLSQ